MVNSKRIRDIQHIISADNPCYRPSEEFSNSPQALSTTFITHICIFSTYACSEPRVEATNRAFARFHLESGPGQI